MYVWKAKRPKPLQLLEFLHHCSTLVAMVTCYQYVCTGLLHVRMVANLHRSYCTLR